MAKQIINVGATANDKKGDSLRAAFTKVNANFTELYTALGLNTDGTLNLGAFEFNGSTMSTTDSTAITIDQAVTVSSDLTVGGDILPSVPNGGNLGSLAKPFNSLYVSTSTVYLGGVPLSLEPGTNTLKVNNVPISQNITYTDIPDAPTDVSELTDNEGLLGGGANTGNISFDTGGTAAGIYNNQGGSVVISNFSFWTAEAETAWIEIPAGNSSDPLRIVQEQGNVLLGANNKAWTFDTDGKLTLPGGADTITSNTNGLDLSVLGIDNETVLTVNLSRSGALNVPQAVNFNFLGTYTGFIGSQPNEIVIAGVPNTSIRIAPNDGANGTFLFGTDGSLTVPGDIKSQGNINIDINLSDSTLRRWQFGEDGNLTLPVGGDIKDSNGNSVLGGGNANTGDITFDGVKIIGNTAPGVPFNAIGLIPDNRTVDGYNFVDNGQFLVVYPTTGFDGDTPHIHIAAGAGPNGNGDLILGDDNLNVEINHQGYVVIKSYDQLRNNNYYWYFGNDGTLSGPGMGSVIVPAVVGTPGNDLYLGPGGSIRNTVDLQFIDANGTSKSVYTVNTNDYYVGSIPPTGGASLWYQNGSTVTINSIVLGSGTATFTFGDPVVLNAATTYIAEWQGTDRHHVTIGTENGSWRFSSDGSLVPGNKTVIDNTGNSITGPTLTLGTLGSTSIITQPENTNSVTGGHIIRIQGQRGYGTWSNTTANAGDGGHIEIRAGQGGETGGDLNTVNGGEGGYIDIIAGTGQAGKGGGYVTIRGGGATMSGGSPNNVYGGAVYIQGGHGWDSNAANKGFGGDVYIEAGQGNHANGHANVQISTYNGLWQFRPNGSFEINNSQTRTTSIGLNDSGIIWTSVYDYISSAKLVIQLETNEVGDNTGWHSQVCEAIIASRGYANSAGGPFGEPIMTVYGVTYTSTAPLATFTVQRNPTTKKIEVVATRTAATIDGLNFRIHSVEMSTSD